MKNYSFFAIGYFLVVSVVLAFLGCSSKERQHDEVLVRLDPKALNYKKPIEEKELPIFDPKLAFFEYNRASLTSEARKALIPTAEFLKQNPKVRLVVEGYCDERGSDDYNMRLGLRRANSVKHFLKQRGIPDSSVDTVSYGKVLGSGERVWAQNRRAGFQIVYPRGE